MSDPRHIASEDLDRWLVELAYGESSLVPDDVRATIAADPELSRQLAELVEARSLATLPLDEPSAEMDARILAAADAFLAGELETEAPDARAGTLPAPIDLSAAREARRAAQSPAANAPAPSSATGSSDAAPTPAWTRWLRPVALAASFAIVVGGSVAVMRGDLASHRAPETGVAPVSSSPVAQHDAAKTAEEAARQREEFDDADAKAKLDSAKFAAEAMNAAATAQPVDAPAGRTARELEASKSAIVADLEREDGLSAGAGRGGIGGGGAGVGGLGFGSRGPSTTLDTATPRVAPLPDGKPVGVTDVATGRDDLDKDRASLAKESAGARAESTMRDDRAPAAERGVAVPSAPAPAPAPPPPVSATPPLRFEHVPPPAKGDSQVAAAEPLEESRREAPKQALAEKKSEADDEFALTPMVRKQVASAPAPTAAVRPSTVVESDVLSLARTSIAKGRAFLASGNHTDALGSFRSARRSVEALPNHTLRAEWADAAEGEIDALLALGYVAEADRLAETLGRAVPTRASGYTRAKSLRMNETIPGSGNSAPAADELRTK